MLKYLKQSEIIWGYSATALNVGFGLILLPIVLHYLSKDDAGMWFVFLTISSLTQLLEFGFQPTLARNVAYVFAGSQKLKSIGVPELEKNEKKVNLVLLSNLVYAAKEIYKIIFYIATIILFFGGSIYVILIASPDQNITQTILAWNLFSLGCLMNLYFGHINAILQGSGHITSANKAIVISKITFIITGVLTLSLNLGLLGLGIASLISAGISRLVLYKYMITLITPKIKLRPDSKSKKERIELRKLLWANASRLGLVQVGAFLIQRASILIVPIYLGLEETANYGLTVTALLALMSISLVYCNLNLPKVNRLQSIRSINEISKLYIEITIHACIIYVVGLVFIVLFGNKIFNFLGSKTELISQPLLIILGIIIFLELNHSIAANLITTFNEIPFLMSAIISGTVILLVALILTPYLGILGLILSQGVVQILYNNWKWPIYLSKKINIARVR